MSTLLLFLLSRTMQGLLTLEGLRVLVARKLDALHHDRVDHSANGDLATVNGHGKFFVYLDFNENFDEHTDARVHLLQFSDNLNGEPISLMIDTHKYIFNMRYVRHEVNEDYEVTEEEDAFLEIHGTTHVLPQGFDNSTKRLTSLLKTIHFMQLIKRCKGCNTAMSTACQLCMQCDCATARTQETYFCSVCQEHTRSGDVIVSLPCNHQLHLQCFDKLDRCPVCRKGCRGSSVETKVCQ